MTFKRLKLGGGGTKTVLWSEAQKESGKGGKATTLMLREKILDFTACLISSQSTRP